MKIMRLLFVLAIIAVPTPTHAQQRDPNQMCGDGSVINVTLPGRSLGFDDANSIFTSISPTEGNLDTITLPGGCRIYAFLVSGYRENAEFREIIFYKFAEFVARNNGYVHVSWWNNILRPYMERPMHDVTVTVDRAFPLPNQVLPPFPYNPFAPLVTFDLLPTFVDMPKANPDEDIQFQSDMALVIKAIKDHDDTAIVVVAGHSMGGASVVRLGLDKTVPIDLLAPIDAGNNRDKPVGVEDTKTHNRTRWRGTHNYRGWKQYDCVRTNGDSGPCQLFVTSVFPPSFSFQCHWANTWLLEKPLLPTVPNIAGCWKSAPLEDVNAPTHTFGDNVKNLYFRWQHEFKPPADYDRTYRFNHHKPLSPSLFGGNYQYPVFRAVDDPQGLIDPRDKTCALGLDPRDPSRLCSPIDGHMEIIGARFSIGFEAIDRAGFEMRNWPHDIAGRRAAMIDMTTATPSWTHRPQDPELCMVCDDLIAITQHLLDLVPTPSTDTTAPVATAIANPEANAAGWNNEDVVLTVLASDEAQGSGVKEVQTSLTGAQTGTTLTPGATAERIVSAEGMTTVSYFARDNRGNTGAEATVSVRIDKTAPQISGSVDGEPNTHGWFNRNVIVSFTATDEAGGSGLASVSPARVVSLEGANQEVGTAHDIAENEKTVVVTVNIDKTAPAISLTSRTLANAFGWNKDDVVVAWSCGDGGAGPVSASVTQTVSVEGAGQQATGTCLDFADNASNDTVGNINIDKTAPSISIVSPPDGSVFLLNAHVTAHYGCADALSGIGSCAGSTPNGGALDTSTVGAKSLIVTATDVAGNANTAASSYGVRYVFSGFASPLAAPPLMTVARAGRTIPIRYALSDGNGSLIADLASFVSLTSRAIACDGSGEGAVAEETEAPGSTSIAFADGMFHYNWQTESSWTGCRVLELRLNDGAVHTAKFQFR